MQFVFMLITVAAVAGLIFILIKSPEMKQQTVRFKSLKDIERYAREEVDKAISLSVMTLGLTPEQAEAQLSQRESLSLYVANASSGDRGARKATQRLVMDKLSPILTEEDIDRCMPTEIGFVSDRTMLELLIYRRDSNIIHPEDALGLADDGFANLIEAYNLSGSRSLTHKKLAEIYAIDGQGVSYKEKLHILVQTVFADLYGLGIVDTLNYQTVGVEEILIGFRGPLTRAYDYRTFMNGTGDQTCSKDSTDILYKGSLMCIEFLGHASNSEMRRVIDRLIVNAHAGELTEATPRIVTETIDGRRITAAIPPQTDGDQALIRKFNLADLNLQNLYPAPVLISYLTFLTRSGAHIAVTGEMETGKTVLLRALLALTDEKYAIRIIEAESFELDGRAYFPMRNISSYRTTQELTEDDVLAFVRKSSGQIFTVGEVNSPATANIENKLSKIATQTMFSAHYTSTPNMISEFTAAKLQDGYTSEKLAEAEVVNGINLDVHICKIDGVGRRIEYINEIIPLKTGYGVVTLMKYDMDTDSYILLSKPSEKIMNKAKMMMSGEEYNSFKEFLAPLDVVTKSAWMESVYAEEDTEEE